MQAINDLITGTLKWTDAADFFGLFLLIAVALFVILLITLIAVAACHGKNKKKFKKMQAQIDNAQSSGAPAADEAALRAEIERQVREELEQQYAERDPQGYADREQIKEELRAETESEIRRQVEAEYAAMQAQTADDGGTAELQSKIDELNATIDEKNARIDELGTLLMQSNSDRTTDNSELYKQLNALSRENGDMQKEINALRDENERLKAKPAAQSAKATGKTTTPRTSSPAPKTTPVTKTPKTVEPDDDDDEIYNDYADANTTVKVTLKYDRAKSSWVIYRSDIPTRAYRRIGTKQEALVVARDLAKRMHCPLIVHKKDGKFQKA